MADVQAAARWGALPRDNDVVKPGCAREAIRLRQLPTGGVMKAQPVMRGEMQGQFGVKAPHSAALAAGP